MRGFLREIQGVEGTGTSYLALGSTAFAAGRMEIALEIYLVALRAPDLLEAARQDPMIWRGLLMGFAAALDLGRLDDAQRFLEIVERIADEPHEEMAAELAAYRIALAEARAKQDTDSSVTPKKKPGPQAPGTGTAGGEETEARLEPAGIRPERHRREADLDAASHPPTEDRPLWPIAVGVLGIALLLGAWLRVRRGAPSG
jgi:hypothetical protein